MSSTVADKVLLVGDPGRVDMFKDVFESIEYESYNRELHALTGRYHGIRMTALSTGMGCDNIDIVMTELDGLANIDFETRTPRAEHRTLNIVRIGTSGGLQPYVPVGTPVIASKAIGFDGVINYYADRNKVADLDFEKQFCAFVKWNELFAKPYVVDADPWLVEKIGRDDMVRGYTISAVGFYGPQGRRVRLDLAEPELNSRIEQFEYNGGRITNYEMESSALQGMAAMLGHRAMTVCSIIANRVATDVNPNYKTAVEDLVKTVLDRLTE
jgi:uridine phosphorylase